MAGGRTRYAKALAFRSVDPKHDRATLIAFGRGLYLESLGDLRAFERDHGPGGDRFPAWIASCLAVNKNFAVFLIEDGAPIGMAVLGADARRKGVGHVHHFYVRQSWRGQGFGGLLDEYARKILKKAGYERARLNVTRENDRALRFYVAQGWEPCSSEVNNKSVLRHMELAL